MDNYQKHALMEFRAAGWLNEKDEYVDEMQEMICSHVLDLLEAFGGEGHSGSSAPYTIKLFSKLASFEPIAPLTGEEWEWNDVGEQSGSILWQNKRCSHVFKDSEGAYDIDGVVWYDWYTDENGEKHKNHFTNFQSRVPVVFPYIPKTEYKEWVENEST